MPDAPTFWDLPVVAAWIAGIAAEGTYGCDWAWITTPTGLKVDIEVNLRSGAMRFDPRGVLAPPPNMAAISAAIADFDKAKRSARRRNAGLATAAANRARAAAARKEATDA